MGVMSIRLDDQKKKSLKVIASIEGKTIGGLVGELIDGYIEKNKIKINNIVKSDHLEDIIKISEASFLEWDNEEDEIYNEL